MLPNSRLGDFDPYPRSALAVYDIMQTLGREM